MTTQAIVKIQDVLLDLRRTSAVWPLARRGTADQDRVFAFGDAARNEGSTTPAPYEKPHEDIDWCKANMPLGKPVAQPMLVQALLVSWIEREIRKKLRRQYPDIVIKPLSVSLSVSSHDDVMVETELEAHGSVVEVSKTDAGSTITVFCEIVDTADQRAYYAGRVVFICRPE